jgi:hypothetical protein
MALTLATIAIGVAIAAISAAATVAIASYGGMLGPVRCFDPTRSPCTSLYYFNAIPGYPPLIVCIAGIALAAIGVAVLLRSRPSRPHP